MYANKLVTTMRAIENKITSRSRVMEPALSWRGLMALLKWWQGKEGEGLTEEFLWRLWNTLSLHQNC
eukprot:91932-Pelagomonas_calceolata.AAC.1